MVDGTLTLDLDFESLPEVRGPHRMDYPPTRWP